MKRFYVKPKFIMALGTASLVILTAVSFMGHNISGQQNKLMQMNSGVGICFQRVTQTFTALMIRDFSSSYLADDFKKMTGDCFNEVSEGLAGMAAANSGLAKNLNNLSSDLHWFHKKIVKVASQVQSEGLDLTESNVVGKFENLEQLKTQVEDTILTSASEMEASKNLSLAGIILAQIALFLSAMGFFFQRRFRKEELNSVEAIAAQIDGGVEAEEDIERVVESLFNTVEMPKTKEALMAFHSDLVKSYREMEANLVKMNSIEYLSESANFEMASPAEDKREKTNFNNSLNTVLDRVQDKAFHHGIIMDTDFSDEFEVHSGAEALEQLLFYTLSFAMDQSLAHNDGRKVVIKSKPLGGIAYCKVKIGKHVFSDSDMDVLNGKEPTAETNVNLLLLKELISDANATLAVKNKQNQSNNTIESEMEMVFERAKPQAAKASVQEDKNVKVNVFKGSKKEIRKLLDQSL